MGPGQFDIPKVQPAEKKDNISPTQPRERPIPPKDSDDRKKFKEMMKEKPKKGGDETEEVGESLEGESPFDILTKTIKSKRENTLGMAVPQETLPSAEEAPAKLEDVSEAKVDELKNQLQGALPDILKSMLAKESSTTPLVVEAPTEDAGVETVESRREMLLQLISQMVDALQEITKKDLKETSFTIKYPPLFEGVEIKITEYKQASKEFNISFFNLENAEARALIESRLNQESLRTHLADRGYVLHMVTIEPKKEVEIRTAAAEAQYQSREQKKRQEKESSGGLF